MEGWREIKLSKCQQWRRERARRGKKNYWGRRSLKRGSKDRAVGGEKVAAPTARPWPGLAGQELEAVGLGPALRPAWAGQTTEKHPTRK